MENVDPKVYQNSTSLSRSISICALKENRVYDVQRHRKRMAYIGLLIRGSEYAWLSFAHTYSIMAIDDRVMLESS